MWRSKRHYSIDGHVGRLETMGKSPYLVLVKSNGSVVRMIDQGKAAAIRAAEDQKEVVGRPSLFPGVYVESHSITLPKGVWSKIDPPYSLAIEKLISEKTKS